MALKNSAQSTDALPRLRILLAEDNPINQIIVSKVLGKLGYTTDVAKTGTQVLNALESTFYDLILMDVHMPEMDGYDASRAIIEQFKNAERKPLIIALTASISEHDMWKCLDAGMSDSLPKPFEDTSFIAMLNKWKTHFTETSTKNNMT